MRAPPPQQGSDSWRGRFGWYYSAKLNNSQSYGFCFCFLFSLWLGHKEGLVMKNWCLQIVVLEKSLESPLDSKDIKPVNPKGNQPWIFIGRTDTEAPILWSLYAKSQLIGKDSDAGKDFGQKKRVTEEKMIRYHHWLNWTWMWANSGRQWRTGKSSCVLQSMGSQSQT